MTTETQSAEHPEEYPAAQPSGRPEELAVEHLEKPIAGQREEPPAY